MPKQTKQSTEPKIKLSKIDKNHPRGPSSAYIHFSNKVRPTLPADVSATDKLKLLGERWKCATPEEKADAARLAAEDKARYEREMTAYVPPTGAELKKLIRKKKTKRDPALPKRPLSAYMYYGQHRRPTLGAMSVADTGRLLGKEWGQMDAAAKAPFVKQSVEDKARYIREMEAYTPASA